MQAFLLALLFSLQAVAADGPPVLQQLTVPARQLPPDCVLSAAPAVARDGDTVRGGLWAVLPITSNPWIGSDPRVVAAIRERIEPPPAVADGPPLSSAERARFRLRLAEGVEAAYAAVYVDARDRSVVVYGMTLTGRADPVTRIVGADSACAEAVATHITGKRR